MNRPIICRAKTIDNAEWITGYLIQLDKDSRFLRGEGTYLLSQREFILVNPETVCQLTGIPGYKKSPIFEGDICVDVHNDLWIVKYINGCFWFCNPFDKSNKNTYDWLKDWDYWSKGMAAIGTIFDNADLLKKAY